MVINGKLLAPAADAANETSPRIGARFRTHLGVVGLYTALALGLTWPMVRNFTSRIIGEVWFDQRHAVWILWHVKEALLGRQSLFETTLLYYPHGVSTVVDGVGPVSGLLALPFWPWGPVAAYNGALLVGFVLTGWCMYLLARRVALDHESAVFTGALFMLWPIHVVAVYGHLEKAFMGLLPLNVLAAVLGFDPERRPLWVFAPAVTLLVTLLHNGNQFIFALLAMVVLFVLRASTMPRSTRWALVVRGAQCASAAAMLNGLLLVEFGRAATDPRMVVALGIQSPFYSPDVLQFVVPSVHQTFLGFWPSPADMRGGLTSPITSLNKTPCCPGWYGSGIETAVTIPFSVIILAGLAFCYRRPTTVPWLTFGCVFGLLSLGPYLRAGGRTVFTDYNIPIVLPFAFLASVPGLDVMRTPGRFMMAGAVGFALAAGVGFAAVRQRWPHSAKVTAWSVIAIVLVECWPHPWAQQVPLPVSAFHQQLGTQAGRDAVFDLPSGLRAESASAYQWYQLTHGRPIAWGYLSREFLEHPLASVREVIGEKVTNAAELRLQLVDLGYRYLVWHKYAESLFFDRRPHRMVEGTPTAAWRNGFIRAAFRRESPVFEDSAITVYRLDRPSGVANLIRPRASVAVDPLAAWTGKQGDADDLVDWEILPADGRGIRWLRDGCRDGNVEVLEWTTDGRIRASGWGYARQRGVVDVVLITVRNGMVLEPLAAVIPTKPRADVAQQFGARAAHSGWSLELTPPKREIQLEFWGLDAKRLEASPLCSITGDYRLRPTSSRPLR